MIFGIKKNDNFDPYNIFLAIATNIPVQLKTGFVVLGHKCAFKSEVTIFWKWLENVCFNHNNHKFNLIHVFVHV